jgi:hypothetical protein
VSEKHYGTAFGIISSISNAGLVFGSILVGSILDVGILENELVNLE